MTKIRLCGKRDERHRLTRNSRGMTYLLVSSLLIVVLIGFFFAEKKYTYQDRMTLYSVKIRAMNDFVKNFNTDIHRATHVSAFRAMIALEDNVAGSGRFLNNVSSSFKETFYNGTINGTTVEIMRNSSFKDYITKVQSIAKDVGITLNASVEDVYLSQSDPWYIDVNVSIRFNLTDPTSKVSWIIYDQYYTSVPIENLRDPMHSVYTLNKLPNSVRKCNYTELVTPGGNTAHLEECINQSSYLESTFAPSFLMRFEGNTSADPRGHGIESIVYIPTLSAQELTVYPDAVKVDYIYFGNLTTDKVCDIENINPDSKFVIPTSHIGIYQIGGLNYSTSCP